MKTKNQLLRTLPKVDECLADLMPYVQEHGVPMRIAKKAVQQEIDQCRQSIIDGASDGQPNLQDWRERFQKAIDKLMEPKFRRVINGTGVVIHTNLGRSLLSSQATEQLIAASGYYSNLEFDLESGKRGSRYSLVEELICDLSGAEAALVVNNNAAAVLIALETIAQGKEVVVSRGQLVEIGGSFRIPEVMAKSGALLVEVGATNRTHLRDYERAINENTALLLKVHTSNFRIIGFTSQVSAEELSVLAREHDIAVMEDLGSGSLIDMRRFGLPEETTVQEILQAGVDVVTFSGDKLLGGPQAGIIVGKRNIIEKIKKNPLNRAMRIDKFTLAALESTLRSYYDLEKAIRDIPTLRMISDSPENIKKRARRLIRRIGTNIAEHCRLTLSPTTSRVGGGALPEYGLDSWAVELSPVTLPVNAIERDFRKLRLPLIGRIERDSLLIDLRTVNDQEVPELAELLVSYFNSLN